MEPGRPAQRPPALRPLQTIEKTRALARKLPPRVNHHQATRSSNIHKTNRPVSTSANHSLKFVCSCIAPTPRHPFFPSPKNEDTCSICSSGQHSNQPSSANTTTITSAHTGSLQFMHNFRAHRQPLLLTLASPWKKMAKITPHKNSKLPPDVYLLSDPRCSA